MKFDPEEFIELATRNGFELSRIGDRMFVRPAHHITPEWREAFARHKPQLIGRLRAIERRCRPRPHV